ncbi:MAG: GNAT family N-acetyltransferase [Oscillospiraceae bacterium]|nr:GNAT family N-acetyltransferase [Oscillospiraceae bacterium]
MKHKGTVTLETERLILRRFMLEDAEAMFRSLYSDAEAMRYLPWETHTDIAESVALVDGYVKGYKNDAYYAWAIVLKAVNEPIGFIDTFVDDSIDAVKVDYGIGKAWWHQGYTGEALSALIQYFFEEVGANRVYATHDPRNPDSGAVMRKCGMTFEGTLRQARKRKGEYSDRAEYAILAGEYRGQKQLPDLAAINCENYTEHNSAVIDHWTDENWIWGQEITHETYEAAKRGEWSIWLTPTKPVPRDWLPALRGTKVLGLACGGGQQMPIFTALGAECTVLDYSEKMLEKDRLVAEREGYYITVVRADMTKRLPFEDGIFDLIFHPVSNCYISPEDVHHVWRECYRVLKSGGILLAGMDNGFDFLFDTYDRPLTIQNTYPFNPLKNPEQMAKLMAEDDGIQFSHGIGEQIDGQLAAGFRLTNVFDDKYTSAGVDDYPGYWATRAVKD